MEDQGRGGDLLSAPQVGTSPATTGALGALPPDPRLGNSCPSTGETRLWRDSDRIGRINEDPDEVGKVRVVHCLE